MEEKKSLSRETVGITQHFEPAARKGSTSAIDEAARDAEKNWAAQQEAKTQSMVQSQKASAIKKRALSVEAEKASATGGEVNNTKVIPMNTVPTPGAKPDMRVHKKQSFENKVKSHSYFS